MANFLSAAFRLAVKRQTLVMLVERLTTSGSFHRSGFEGGLNPGFDVFSAGHQASPEADALAAVAIPAESVYGYTGLLGYLVHRHETVCDNLHAVLRSLVVTDYRLNRY
jgi:hypothetical protein